MEDQADNILVNEQVNKESLREGEYMLTPMQYILINKLMPRGLKLETKENIIRAVESVRPVVKKQKISHGEEAAKRTRKKKMDFSEDNSEFSSNNKKRSCREKKPIVYEDLGYVEKDKLKGPKNPLLADVTKKCERGFQRIKKHPFAEYFMNPNTPDAPSLSQIERNIKNYAYTTVYQFSMDLRKLWAHHFTASTGSGEVFQRTCKLSEFSEDVIKEVESAQEEKSDIHELSKKVEKLTKEVKEISYKGNTQSTLPPTTTKKGDKSVNILDKPMSMNDKNVLGNAIKNLTTEQLKGIVSILSDSLVIDPQSRYFEFDIETLSTRKLRELERYVKNCLKNTKPLTSTGTNKPPANNNTKQAKKPTATSSSVKPAQGGELTENERVAKLKNDLAIRNQIANSTNNSSNLITPQLTHQNQQGNKDNKNALSESDDSLSSSESDSESLSSLDFKKQPIK